MLTKALLYFTCKIRTQINTYLNLCSDEITQSEHHLSWILEAGQGNDLYVIFQNLFSQWTVIIDFSR